MKSAVILMSLLSASTSLVSAAPWGFGSMLAGGIAGGVGAGVGSAATGAIINHFTGGGKEEKESKKAQQSQQASPVVLGPAPAGYMWSMGPNNTWQLVPLPPAPVAAPVQQSAPVAAPVQQSVPVQPVVASVPTMSCPPIVGNSVYYHNGKVIQYDLDTEEEGPHVLKVIFRPKSTATPTSCPVKLTTDGSKEYKVKQVKFKVGPDTDVEGNYIVRISS